MMKKKWLITSICLLIISIIYTILIQKIDVSPIACNGSNVGFATINTFFKDIIGNHMLFYDITKYLGLIPIFMAICYGLVGLYQLVKRKSIKKVNKKLIALGVFYVVFVLIYVFFEKVAINYRPFLIDGEAEASYPSTHTLLAICICGSSLMISKYIFKENIVNILNKLTWIVMILIVLGRIISGVHWISDIVGGIIISLFMLSSLYTVLLYLDKKDEVH